MTRVEILKNKDIGLLKRDINEFIIHLENDGLYNSHKGYNIDNIQIMNDPIHEYIAIITYSLKG